MRLEKKKKKKIRDYTTRPGPTDVLWFRRVGFRCKNGADGRCGGGGGASTNGRLTSVIARGREKREQTPTMNASYRTTMIINKQ